MQINCRIIAEQDWQKSAREPSRCILRSQSYVLLRSHFHAPPSTVPQCHPISQCHAIPALTATFSCLHIFWELFTCLQLFASPLLHLRLSDFYFCIFVFIFVFVFLASPRLFSRISPHCILFQLFSSVFNSFCSLTLFSFTFLLIQQFPFYLFYNFLHPPFSFFHPFPFAPIKKHIISTVDDLK